MKYCCLSCNSVFTSDSLGAEHYECPVCGDDLEEMDECFLCGDLFIKENLYGGYCEQCLRDSLTEFTAERYLSDTGYLVQFMCEYVWEMDRVPECNDRFRALCMAQFVQDYKSLRHLVEQFIMDDDGDGGRDDYARWYSKYLNKAKNKVRSKETDG